jgi:hypothetical protein
MGESKTTEALQALANGLEQASKAGAFGLQDSATLLQALQIVAQALAPQPETKEDAPKVKE